MTQTPGSDPLCPEDGYQLWLRYVPITHAPTRAAYRAALTQVVMQATSPTLIAAQEELGLGLTGLLDMPVSLAERVVQAGTLVIGTPQSSAAVASLHLQDDLRQVGDEGFVIVRAPIAGKDCIAIAANTNIGLLYGVFHFLRHLQTHGSLLNLHIVSAPKIKLRMLNHWDNLDRTIERGYAGFSLWDWHKLPDYVDPRYKDYARANASIGINCAVLTNVNAHALILTRQYLVKVAALADVLRPYGIRAFLTARFSAPIEIGRLKTADPLGPDVIAWWNAKADEIYELIPDFGGFVVKANSEGQPGPHDYGRSHSAGANLLADALAPHGGAVIWRAFVYDPDVPDDRAKQAYDDLVPQDGMFRSNAFLQVKNGPIDFQPREPHHTLFGAMPRTPLLLEVQITQEYLGCATHLAYLAPLFQEVLDADTYCSGPGSLVARVVDGSLDGYAVSGMAGVSNIGNDRNWCGHPFAAANWYAFGRLAWDHRLASEAIADEWLRMTFTNKEEFVESAKAIMMASREAVVDYMTPLGLHHIMARDHHYGPGPWVEGGRADWTSLYYHRADAVGVGFDRTATGSNAVSHYFSPYREQLADPDTCPEELLLWFHHVPWQRIMKSGRTLWDELCFRYNYGVESVRQMQRTWDSLAAFVDRARFEHVQTLLKIQEQEARWWRDACLLYFQTFSRLPIPPGYEQPAETLDYYMNLKHYYVPGIPERRFK
ncbi:MAG: alpha-glucuronidase [Anaerolineae bacterium]|nr:alpha-glucuronidase [Anaerolineae bacterium]